MNETDTPTPTDPVRAAFDALKTQLTHDLECTTSLVKTRADYAQQYAYDALIKHHVYPGAEHRQQEQSAACSAFWHDGSRDGYESGVYSLVNAIKLLEQLEIALYGDPTAKGLQK